MQSIGLAPAATYEGFVDAIEDGVVYGWAWSPESPEEFLLVDIVCRDEVIGTVEASLSRPDLTRMELGQGNHAFEFVLPDNLVGALPAEIDVRYSGTGVPLPRVKEGERRLAVPGGTPRSDNEVILALQARIESQEQFIAYVSNLLRVLVENIKENQKRDLTEADIENLEDGEAEESWNSRMESMVKQQSENMEALDIYMSTLNRSFREYVESNAGDERDPNKIRKEVNVINVSFIVIIVALISSFSAYYLFFDK